MLERWLEKQLKACFNPLLDVVATQEITNKKGNLKSCSDTRHVNSVFHKDNLKEKKFLCKKINSRKTAKKTMFNSFPKIT